MKRPILLPIVVGFAFASPVNAQAPEIISFQGRLESSGIAVNDTLPFTFSLFDSASTLIWSEGYAELPVVDGVFSVHLGSVVDEIRTLSFDHQYEFRVTVNTEPDIVSHLTSAPYALNLRHLRVYPVAGNKGPNMIGGSYANLMAPSLEGVTISGGGANNSVTLGSCTARSGPTFSNFAGGQFSTIGGGYDNYACTRSTVSGGSGNVASGSSATVAGGLMNEATGDDASIGGGEANTASGDWSTVPGGNANTASGNFSFAAGDKASALHTGSFVWSDSTGLGLPFSSTAPNQFLVRARGGVGIGTSAPEEHLHVQEAIGSSGLQLGGGGTNGPHGIVFDDNVANQGVQLFFRTGPNELVLEKTSLGTAVDGADVFNYDRDDDTFGFNADVYPITTSMYSLGRSGNEWTEVWASNGTIQSSDERLKDEIGPIPYGLREIMELEPVSFSWKSNAAQGRHLGLVAQDVSEVVPEVVRGTGRSSEMMGMNYAELVPVLIRAVQEQQARIEALEAVHQAAIQYPTTK